MKKVYLLLIAGLFLLTGCTTDEKLTDGNIQISDELNTIISDYIVDYYDEAYSHTEQHFEAHKIYGTSENNDVLTVYMWSAMGGFNKETGTDTQAGHSLPAVIKLKKDNDSYTVINYEEPQDGSLYIKSIDKMFPEQYRKYIYNDAGNVDELHDQVKKQAAQWLANQ